MTPPRDPEAHDLYLDRLLAEQLGGERPRDLADRILGATPAAMAQAAARVEAAAEADADEVAEARPTAGRRHGWWLAAALLLGAAGALVLTSRAQPTVAERTVALLDAFHRVMPQDPPLLRDPEWRALRAAAAIPVLREIEPFFAAHPDGLGWRVRAPEFTVYLLVLDDEATRERVAAEAQGGRSGATLLLAAAAAITAMDEAARRTALQQVAAHLDAAADVAAGAVTCLLTAGDLTAEEALQLAGATTDEGLARRLRVGAELADSDPRRLLGKPFELAGRLHTGEPFSTTSLRGKVVLVFFWASWCAPCRVVLPEVVAAAARHAERGLAVVGVSCDHDGDELTAFLAAHPQANWPQLFEAGQSGWHPLAFWSGVRAVPRLFLVDRRGILREVHARGDLDRLVEKLLAEPR